MGVKTHPSAQEVYEGVKEKLPNIGVATVYRNLDKLVEEGKIKEFDFGEKKKRYDGAVHPHQHFVCTQCARVIDMELSKLLNIEKTVEKVQCHRVESYELELRGVCSLCLGDRGQRPLP